MNVLLTGAFPSEKMPEDSLLRAMIERCTRLEPSDRYGDLEELMGAILAIRGQTPGTGDLPPAAAGTLLKVIFQRT